MKLLFMYPPSCYLNHSMFKHYTYFAETINLVSAYYPDITVMDCGVEMKSRNEIYEAFGTADTLIMLVEPYNIQTALELITIYKDIKPQGTAILYGTAAVLIPNYLSRQENVDYVIANGNFVSGIVSILRDLEQGVAAAHKIVSLPDDSQQHEWGCALDAPVPLELYRHFGNNMLEFTVQVGCPFNCTFCSEKLLFPQNKNFVYAQRPVDNIISIMKRAKNNFDSVYFSATTFTVDRQWVRDICREMIKNDCIIPWRSDTRIDCLDPELLRDMKKAGLSQLSLGIESFEDHLLDSVNKCQDSDTIYEKVKMCKSHGVNVKALLILGLPGQTASDVLNTQQIIEELDIPYRWKEYSPIRELHIADSQNQDIADKINGFNRTGFRADTIPGLSAEKYMSLLFPRGYIR